MKYTPQQLAGGQFYQSGTRVGNWEEDINVYQAKVAEFLTAKAGNGLSLQKRTAKLNKCQQRVELSPSSDGYVRFGDVVALEHLESGTQVGVDLWEEIFPGQEPKLVSAPKVSYGISKHEGRRLYRLACDCTSFFTTHEQQQQKQ